MENIKVNLADKHTGGEKYIFQLFVTNNSPSSNKATKNIKAICEKYLTGNYELEIINIYEQPSFAITENVITIPLLIKKFPLPEERLVGDLSDTEKVLKGLYLV